MCDGNLLLAFVGTIFKVNKRIMGINCFAVLRALTSAYTVMYSASSLERPFLWFMVNDYVLCHQIAVIRMKSDLDVPYHSLAC